MGTITATMGRCNEPANLFDQCLHNAVGVYNTIEAAGGFPTAFGYCWRCAKAPWVEMPPEARRFQRVSSIALPVDNAVDNLVMTFQVPLGYDGVLLTLTNVFTGSGFLEASGDITWRLKINNQYYLRDLGAIQVSLGDLSIPYALEGGGYRLKSGQVLSYYVSIAVGAAARLNPAGRVLCGVSGWVYPHTLLR